MSLVRGFWAPFRGAVFVARHRLWGPVAIPLLINIALAVLAGRLGLAFVRSKIDTSALVHMAPRIAGLVEILLTIIAAVVLFIFLQPVVAAPFVDALTERAEILVNGGHPRLSFWLSTWKAVLHGILKLFLYGLALVATWLLTTVLNVVGGMVGVAVYGLFVAYDGFDYPLGRRGVGFAGKWAYLFRNPGLTTGYAAGAFLLYLVPLALVIAPPFAAVGATLAFLEQERQAG